MVASLQTFGSFAAIFNPHCHGLVTEGVFASLESFFLYPCPRLASSRTSKSVSGSLRYELLTAVTIKLVDRGIEQNDACSSGALEPRRPGRLQLLLEA